MVVHRNAGVVERAGEATIAGDRLSVVEVETPVDIPGERRPIIQDADDLQLSGSECRHANTHCSQPGGHGGEVSTERACRESSGRDRAPEDDSRPQEQPGEHVVRPNCRWYCRCDGDQTTQDEGAGEYRASPGVKDVTLTRP